MADQVGDSPHLAEPEKDQAERHAPLRPLVIHEIVRAEGKAELGRPASALFWSGLAAGLSMGFSFVAQALLQADLALAHGHHAIASLGYMTGFVIVVLGRQQLFTESTLTAVLPAPQLEPGLPVPGTVVIVSFPHRAAQHGWHRAVNANTMPPTPFHALNMSGLHWWNLPSSVG